MENLSAYLSRFTGNMSGVLGKVYGSLGDMREALGKVCETSGDMREVSGKVCGSLDNVCREEDMMKTSKAMKKKGKIPLKRRGFLVKRTLEHLGEVFF